MKKVLLYGTYRYIEDFKYLFIDKFKVIGYIESINIETDSVYEPNYALNCEESKRYLVIICERKNNEIIKKMKENGIKKYVFFEDLGYMLNNNKFMLFVKIVKFFRKNYFSSYTSNEELFKKMIYKDSYERGFCKTPFNELYLCYDGNVYTCCPNYGYSIIGNMIISKINKIYNSNEAKLLRLSILNKTYAFCNDMQCPFLNKTFDKSITNTRYDEKNICEEGLNLVNIGIDKTCNLYCKSCREKIQLFRGRRYLLSKFLASKIEKSDLIVNSKRIVIAGQGEAFFSKVYQKLLFNSKLCKRNSIDIITNGNLMTKEKIDKLIEKYSEVSINISIDAATEETYKKLRRGGNFKKLISNLEYVGKLRKEKKIKYLNFLFVIQKENYKEIPLLVEMADKYSVDFINYTKIVNWNTYSKKEFKKISMYNDDGSIKKELKLILNDKRLRKGKVKVVNSNVINWEEK